VDGEVFVLERSTLRLVIKATHRVRNWGRYICFLQPLILSPHRLRRGLELQLNIDLSLTSTCL